jgi:hypothetical protein
MMEKRVSRTVKTLSAAVASVVLLQLAACAPHVARPEQLTAPVAIQDNSGEYLCSITRDKTLAEWSDKMANVGLASSIGSTLGAIAGEQALKQVPFVGGMLGQWAGKKIGQKIAIESAGGMDFIKKTSDLSFNTTQDLALYLYVTYFNGDHYAEAVKAAMALYPDLKQQYVPTIVAASASICSSGQCETINDSLCKKGPCK